MKKTGKIALVSLLVVMCLLIGFIIFLYAINPTVYGEGLSVENYENISPNFVNDFFGDEIYYINLPKRREREILCLAELEKLGINAKRSPGIMLDDQQYNDIKHKYGKLSKSQIGCILAHYKVYEKIASGDSEWGLVFEDDIKVIPEVTQQTFGKVMTEILNQDPDAELVFFGYTCLLKTWLGGQQTIYKGKSLKVSRSRPLSTHCYAIRKSTAVEIMKYIKEKGLNIPIDNFLSAKINKKHVYIVDATFPKNTKKASYGYGLVHQSNIFTSDISNIIRPKIAQHF
jgi:GR25 family glycosyltransferase involved in LPS biosynthesis